MFAASLESMLIYRKTPCTHQRKQARLQYANDCAIAAREPLRLNKALSLVLTDRLLLQ